MKKAVLAIVVISICSCCLAQTSDQRCVVTRPRAENGASIVARMLVVNDGDACDMEVRFRGAPATSLIIHRKPASGTLTSEGSKISYTPNAGFVGKDAFDVQWFGMGWGPYKSDKNIRTEVEVTVQGKGAVQSGADAEAPDGE